MATQSNCDHVGAQGRGGIKACPACPPPGRDGSTFILGTGAKRIGSKNAHFVFQSDPCFLPSFHTFQRQIMPFTPF